jgi:hypothetical protein
MIAHSYVGYTSSQYYVQNQIFSSGRSISANGERFSPVKKKCWLAKLLAWTADGFSLLTKARLRKDVKENRCNMETHWDKER